MVQLVIQAISVTSSKARTELQGFHLYSECELRPSLSLLPHSDGYKKKKGTVINYRHLKQK